MRMFRTETVAFVLAIGMVWSASAQYAAKITLSSDRSWISKTVAVKEGMMLSETGKFTIPVASVKNVEFRFEGVTLKMCKDYFRSGDYQTMLNALKQNVAPVIPYSYLPGNLCDYLLWMARGQYWKGDYAGAAETVALIRKSPDQQTANVGALYDVLLLIEAKKIDEAAAALGAINNPEETSAPMAHYVRGRLAFEQFHFRDAIKYFAQILAFHTRDREWMPAATWMEARVYMETDQPKKAASVAGELMMAYPGTQWSGLGEQITKQVQVKE